MNHGFLIGMEKVITAIEPQKRNHNRLNISLDGEFAFSLDRLTAAWLKLGQKIDDSQIETLRAKDEAESAYNRALRFLAYRARSSQELKNYLIQKDYEPSVANQVLERLRQEGYIDDVRFSQDWVENRVTFRPRSQNLLRSELRQKGVTESIIQSTLSNAGLEDYPLALKAGLKVANRYIMSGYEGFQKKMSGYLMRRGFNYDVTHQVIETIWRESRHDQQNDGKLMKMEHLTQ